MEALIFATSSQHKLDELRAILSETPILGLRDLGIVDEIPEEGNTLEENAIAKAKFLFEKTGATALAEDTGLEVHSLNGEPGVKTARYAGEERNMQKNIDKLLHALEEQEDRTARFRTIIALYSKAGVYTFEGIVTGTIAHQMEGDGGFGYDPVFIPDTYNASFAMLPQETKNAISHRARAVEALRQFLHEWKEE